MSFRDFIWLDQTDGEKRIRELLQKNPPNWACKARNWMDKNLLCVFLCSIFFFALVGVLLNWHDAAIALQARSAFKILIAIGIPVFMGTIVGMFVALVLGCIVLQPFKKWSMNKDVGAAAVPFFPKIRYVRQYEIRYGSKLIADVMWISENPKGPWRIGIYQS